MPLRGFEIRPVSTANREANVTPIIASSEIEVRSLVENPKPVVAVLLSIFPGLGQIYLKQTVKGVCILVSSVVLSFVGIGPLIGIPLSALDAYLLAKRLTKGESIREWEWFWEASDQRQGGIDPPPPPATIDPNTFLKGSKWHVVSTDRLQLGEEILGEERRSVDNSQSGTVVTRSFVVSKEQSQSYSVEHEKAFSREFHGDLTVAIVSLGLAANEVVRNTYSISETSKFTITEEIRVDIPARQSVIIVVVWKQKLELGRVLLRNQHGIMVEVPYRVATGITFDVKPIEQ